MTMKNAMIQSVSQLSMISLGAFVNTLFVKIANIFSGALRPFDAGSPRLFSPAAAKRGQVPQHSVETPG